MAATMGPSHILEAASSGRPLQPAPLQVTGCDDLTQVIGLIGLGRTDCDGSATWKRITPSSRKLEQPFADGLVKGEMSLSIQMGDSI